MVILLFLSVFAGAGCQTTSQAENVAPARSAQAVSIERPAVTTVINTAPSQGALIVPREMAPTPSWQHDLPDNSVEDLPAPRGKYKNADGLNVPRPYVAPSAPVGASARCRDGTYSFSQNRRGTCSHHGGVAEWL